MFEFVQLYAIINAYNIIEQSSLLHQIQFARWCN